MSTLADQIIKAARMPGLGLRGGHRGVCSKSYAKDRP